jgi:hypothetical protein
MLASPYYHIQKAGGLVPSTVLKSMLSKFLKKSVYSRLTSCGD